MKTHSPAPASKATSSSWTKTMLDKHTAGAPEYVRDSTTDKVAR